MNRCRSAQFWVHALSDPFQDAVRQLLKAFFPAALAAFERGGRHRVESAARRTILVAAPTPQAAQALSLRQLAALLTQARVGSR